MSPIHVAFVVTKFDVGGMERCVARVANGLDRGMFKASVICLDRSGTAENWIERNDIEVIELEKGSGNSFQIISKLARCLTSIGAHVAHSHNWGTLIETSLATGRVRNLVHIHAERGSVLGSDSPAQFKRYLRRQAMRWAIRKSRVVTTNSFRVAENIENVCGVLGNRLKVIPNGVDVPVSKDILADARKRIRFQLGIAEDVFLVGSVGRLVSVKNFPLALEALARMRERASCERVQLMLVGDGPERNRIERLVDENDLRPRVHFVGHQEDVWGYLAACDAYTNCSISEGMSQSIMEAMAIGRPIVASDVGDSRRMLCGENPCGIVFDSQDRQAYANGIELLMTSSKQHRLFSENALTRHLERYSESAMMQGFEQMYRSAVANNAATREKKLA